MLQGKKSKSLLWLLCLLFAFCIVLEGTSDSYAQSNPYVVAPGNVNYILNGGTGPICSMYVDAVSGTSIPLTGLTSRFVNCILGTVSWTVQRYLGVFGDAFISTVNVMAVLATLLMGFMVLTGRAQAVGREAITLALKVGVVIWLVNFAAFAQLFPTILYTMEWLIGLVTQYTAIQLGNKCPYSPFIWNRIDCAIGILIGGVTPNVSVFSGILGMIVVMLFSSGVGVGLFFFLLGIIITVLNVIFQAMFILLSSYIAIALLVIIAPMMIPLILFRATKAYFEKWMRLLIGVMLQPIFLFTYLTMFLIALEMTLFTGQYSVYRSIACNPNPNIPCIVDAPGFTIGGYIWGSGAIGERSGVSAPWNVSVSQAPKRFDGTPVGTDVRSGGPLGKEAVKETSSPDQPFLPGSFLNMDFTAMAAQLSALAANCGMNTISYFVRLVLSLFTAVAVIYIFSTMLQFIPYLGTLIGGGDLFAIPNLSKMLPSDGITGSKLAEKAGFIKGGGGP